MANVTITALTPAAALTGTEVLAIDQSGSTVKTTVQAVANLAAGGGGATLDVVTVGNLGALANFPIGFQVLAKLSPVGNTQSVEITQYPNINFNGGDPTVTISSLSFTNLTTGGISISNIYTLVTLDLPVFESTLINFGNGMIVTNNSALTTINIPSLISYPDNSLTTFTDNALSQETVDHILERMVATGAVNCSINLLGGTNAIPSTPTGQAAKATLEGRGWSVITN